MLSLGTANFLERPAFEMAIGQDMPIIEDRHELIELVNRLRFIAETLKNLSKDCAFASEEIEKLSKERKNILAHFRAVRPFRRRKYAC